MSRELPKLGAVFYKQSDLPKRAKNLEGIIFGRLKVIAFGGANEKNELMWWCTCRCGNVLKVRGSELTRKGRPTHSCGCIRAEQNRTRRITHGKSKDRIYQVWAKMIDRCHCPSEKAYPGYGGRGIKVYDEWRLHFTAFFDYVSALPNYDLPGYTLDRINNDGNYEPDNVRWATQKEQTRNTRRSNLVAHKGKTQCLQDWANELGINRYTLYSRLKAGWEVDRALDTPAREMERTR